MEISFIGGIFIKLIFTLQHGFHTEKNLQQQTASKYSSENQKLGFIFYVYKLEKTYFSKNV